MKREIFAFATGGEGVGLDLNRQSMAGAVRGRCFTVANDRRFPLTVAIAVFALVHFTLQ